MSNTPETDKLRDQVNANPVAARGLITQHCEDELHRLAAKRRELERPKGVKARLHRTRHLSMNQADSLYREGRLGQWDYELFCVAWHWCAVRHSSYRQDCYYRKHGYVPMVKRINRFRKKLGYDPLPYFDPETRTIVKE